MSSRPPDFDGTLWSMLSMKERAEVHRKRKKAAEALLSEPPEKVPPLPADFVEPDVVAPSPMPDMLPPLGLYGLIAREADRIANGEERDPYDSSG